VRQASKSLCASGRFVCAETSEVQKLARTNEKRIFLMLTDELERKGRRVNDDICFIRKEKLGAKKIAPNEDYAKL
jgi:hypothetical protein